MNKLKKLNKWLTKERAKNLTYIRLETFDYEIIAIGLAYGGSINDKAVLLELGIGVHCVGVIFKLPNYWYKSSEMTNVFISSDFKRTSYGQTLRWHKLVDLQYLHKIECVQGYLNYRNDFIVTSVKYK